MKDIKYLLAYISARDVNVRIESSVQSIISALCEFVWAGNDGILNLLNLTQHPALFRLLASRFQNISYCRLQAT
jgi:hypothetical protein